MGRLSYVELHCRSAFSLLDGASTPETLAACAADLGLASLAITDLDDLGGVVRFARAAAETGVRPIFGAELTLDRGGTVVLLCEGLEGYENLSHLVTEARMGRPRGEPAIGIERLAARHRGLVCLTGGRDGAVDRAWQTHGEPAARELTGSLAEIYPGRLYVEVQDHSLSEDIRRIRGRLELAHRLALPWLVAGDVRHARARDKPTHDALVCLKHRLTLDEAGDRLFPNDARRLASPTEMARRWQSAPVGLLRTLEVDERCRFRLDSLAPTLPAYPLPAGTDDADAFLEARVREGMRARYDRITDAHERQVRHELDVIRHLGLAGYFLIVWDVVRFARSIGVLVQGRGSAANSAVCYCLGITAVDPIGYGLLFERFLSEGRGAPPDIDVDIAHRDREEVLQYVYDRYGRDHAAMVCESITWRGRSAVRDAARVLGLPVELGDALARQVGAVDEKAPSGAEPRRRAAQRPRGEAQRRTEPVVRSATRSRAAADILIDGGLSKAGVDPRGKRVRALIRLLRGLEGVPRHRGIHVGGFVLTGRPLANIVPIEPASMDGRTVIQWDKDDLGPVGLVKIDLLGLGILTLLADALELVREHRNETLDLAHLPPDDPATYRMIQKADTVGVFQIESRAQMSTLPRMAPERFYDLVVQVALIRPGPIQGEMVHPYLRRRRGEEPVRFLHQSLEPVLARTLGVPLFQEQGMRVAIVAAGFTAEKADALRRAMGKKHSEREMARLSLELLTGMEARGIDRGVAERIVKQLGAFASYGFPESHAASFALLVYASAYLKRHYTPEFYAALLNAQPMGFYPIGTIVGDARRHGVEVRRPDVTESRWNATLEASVGGPHRLAVRLGLRLVRGLGGGAREALEKVLGTPIVSIEDFAQRTGLDARSLTRLARAGALDTLAGDEADRRRALWEVLRVARPVAGPLAPRTPAGPDGERLSKPTARDEIRDDYAMTGASATGHPMEVLRDWLAEQNIPVIATLDTMREGPIRVAGLVNSRQRPATAKGFVFLSLEDETGMCNVIVSPQLFTREHDVIVNQPLLLVHGALERRHDVVNIKAAHLEALPNTTLAGRTKGH